MGFGGADWVVFLLRELVLELEVVVKRVRRTLENVEGRELLEDPPPATLVEGWCIADGCLGGRWAFVGGGIGGGGGIALLRGGREMCVVDICGGVEGVGFEGWCLFCGVLTARGLEVWMV